MQSKISHADAHKVHPDDGPACKVHWPSLPCPATHVLSPTRLYMQHVHDHRARRGASFRFLIFVSHPVAPLPSLLDCLCHILSIHLADTAIHSTLSCQTTH